MISIFYLICLVLTIGNLLHLTQKKNQYSDKYYWTMNIIIPIINLGYWLKSMVHSPEAAMIAICFIYLDGTILVALTMFAAMNSLDLKVPGWIKLLVYAITALHIMSIWLCKDNGLYYSSITVLQSDYGTVVQTEPGPLKITHYIYLAFILIALVCMLIIGFAQKRTFSRRTLFSYSLLAIFCIVVYAIEVIFTPKFSVMPGLYTIGSFMITFSYNHIQSHDIFYLIGEKQSKTGFRGFCAFDMNRCLLGYNRQFGEMIPEIKRVNIDEVIPEEYPFSNIVAEIFDDYDERKEFPDTIVFGDKIFSPVLSYFSINEDKPDGYLLELEDVTERQRNLDVVKQYNEKLSREIEEKTRHIQDIQSAVVLGLADVVENRDENTGGHVKRTSDVVKILMDEIRKQGSYKIDSFTAESIIRAAAMHDLGKLSIDNSILCKPGKLTKEEYDCIKTHADKSGDIVHIILDGVEEEHFVNIAYNLARYHHERWDGAGYPDGLLGESIPIEARIMAVADVYDALVSKRCYKDAMSFDQAATIMNDCMGSQFDPAMRPIFVACREKLENYYASNI